MKRITLFLSLLCMIVGGVLAQSNTVPTAGKFYRIKDVKYNKYLTVDKTTNANPAHGDIPLFDKKDNSAGQIWQLEATGTANEYKFKSRDGYFIKCSAWNCDATASDSEASTIMIEQADGNVASYYLRDKAKEAYQKYFKVELVEDNYYPFCDASKDHKNIDTWVFEEVTDIDNKVLVTYCYNLNNVEYKKYSVLQDKNSASSAAPQPFLALGQYSQQNVGETDCTITVQCTENLPFVTSNSFADAKWQVVEMHRFNGCHRYWQYGPQYNTIDVIDFTNNREDVPAENTLWCFVGNLMDGFVIYNMAAGADMTVNAKVDGDKPILGTADSNINRWYIVPSGASNEPNAFCLTHDKSRYMNQQNGKVHYWNQADNGSTCYINEAEQFIFSLGAEDLAKAHKVGAIGVKGHGTQEAQNLVVNYEAVKNNSNFDLEQLKALVASFKAVKNSSVEAEGPKAGYYFIYGTGNGNQNNWRITYDGTNCKAKSLADNQNLGAEHVWYFAPVSDGFKLQSVNLGNYLNLANAPAVSGITSDKDNSHTYHFESNYIDGKFIIKNGDNKVLRTENNGDVNEWNNAVGSELGEKWYIVEAKDLEHTIGNGGYSTVHFPFAVTMPSSDVKAYAIEEANNTKNTVALVAKNEIPANQGAILQGTANQTYKLSITPKSETAVAADDWTSNQLKGSNIATLVQGQAYVLANPANGNGVGLYRTKLNKNAQGETVETGGTHFRNNANKAYLPMPQGAASIKFYGFDFNEDGTTGIENIEDAIMNNANAVIYDLSGRRVQNVAKGGVYIMNGKKVVF